MIATQQLINTTPGSNERAVITVQYATKESDPPRDDIEAALRYTAGQLATCLGMTHVIRLPIAWETSRDDG